MSLKWLASPHILNQLQRSHILWNVFIETVTGSEAQVNSHEGCCDVSILVAVVVKNFWVFLSIEWLFGLGWPHSLTENGRTKSPSFLVIFFFDLNRLQLLWMDCSRVSREWRIHIYEAMYKLYKTPLCLSVWLVVLLPEEADTSLVCNVLMAVGYF